MSANVRSIQALEDMRGALIRFAADAREPLVSACRATDDALEWLAARRAFWRREVERLTLAVQAAARALEACQSERDRNRWGCDYEERHLYEAKRLLREAEEQVALIERCAGAIRFAYDGYRNSQSRLQRMLDVDVPAATAMLRRSADILETYVHMRATAAPRVGSLDFAQPVEPESIGGVTLGPVTAHRGVVEMPIVEIDLSDSRVRSAADFSKVSYDEVRAGYRKLDDVVKPALAGGADGDYFSALDAEAGLDYEHGYRRVYDAFYGDEAITVERRGSSFEVLNGMHRLFVATELGYTSVPVRINE
jgi:hypothetical protein